MKRYFLLFLVLTPIYEIGMGETEPNKYSWRDRRFDNNGWEKMLEEQRRKNEQEIVQTIDERISRKLDLNAPMPNWPGHRPLHRAVLCDATGLLAKRLLEAGADPDVLDDFGNTPLKLAQQNKSQENIKMLLQRVAK